MKKILRLAILLASVNSYAGSADPGNLSNVHFMSDGVVLAYINGNRSDVPSCAVNQPLRFALSTASSGGKVQLAGLLTAYSSGKKIRIIGTGNCSAYGDTETIEYFYLIEN